jgi:hypothetical protein
MADVEQAENLSSDEVETEELQTSHEAEEQLEAEPELEAGEQESEEYEVFLGSAETPSAEEEKPQKKPRGVKRLLAERKESRVRATAQDDRIAELQAQLAATQTNPQANASQAMPIAPTLESCGYDDQLLATANQKYAADMGAFHNNTAVHAARTLQSEQDNGSRVARQQEQQNSAITAHYDRVDKLKMPSYESAEDKLIEILGQEQVTQIIHALPKNSEMVINYLGSNPDKAFDLLDEWQKGPQGVLIKLGGLSADLKLRPRQKKQRAAPESKITAAAPATKSSLEKAIDKERQRIMDGEKNDMTDLNRLKGQLRQATA